MLSTPFQRVRPRCCTIYTKQHFNKCMYTRSDLRQSIYLLILYRLWPLYTYTKNTHITGKVYVIMCVQYYGCIISTYLCFQRFINTSYNVLVRCTLRTTFIVNKLTGGYVSSRNYVFICLIIVIVLYWYVVCYILCLL